MFFLYLFALGAQTIPLASRGDNSDWWSTLRPSAPDEEVNVLKREPAAYNFRILGIELDPDLLEKSAAKLGKATKVTRGDASLGREQACYVSAGNSEKVHLIFEQGEVLSSFYLFVRGADWDGSDQCVPSKLISANLATASGLHLGQTPSQVLAILGKPSVRRRDNLIWSFSVKKKTTPEDLKEARRHNPQMSDEDFHANYDFYDLGVGIDARFVHSRLVYLAISKAETT